MMNSAVPRPMKIIGVQLGRAAAVGALVVVPVSVTRER
jgi:hypothetical protein